ncbi:hypothetical protein [Roseomonas sp. 18066]|uniref:hypothetical protein n=1 Tax=Roseomonas sp. 18066 TaxID=2681412 RepID=UPI00135CF586|nr:hypothetical protein [Roseomonas sp. 18066]
MPQPDQAARAIDALVDDIEGLARRGSVRAEEVFALLHRAIGRRAADHPLGSEADALAAAPPARRASAG